MSEALGDSRSVPIWQQPSAIAILGFGLVVAAYLLTWASFEQTPINDQHALDEVSSKAAAYVDDQPDQGAVFNIAPEDQSSRYSEAEITANFAGGDTVGPVLPLIALIGFGAALASRQCMPPREFPLAAAIAATAALLLTVSKAKAIVDVQDSADWLGLGPYLSVVGSMLALTASVVIYRATSGWRYLAPSSGPPT